MLLILFFILIMITQINSLDYCCCIFSKDPFRGYLTFHNKILSFSHSYLDKEEMGYKMLTQCYIGQNGFPPLENLNMLKRDIYTTNKEKCDKDCNVFLEELNEKYYIKQEENREIEAKRIEKIKHKYQSYLENKILENAKMLNKGGSAKANLKINSKSDLKLKNDLRNSPKKQPTRNDITFSPKQKTLSFEAISIRSDGSDSSVYDLSIDSGDFNEGRSYMEIDNPKYNCQLKIEREQARSKIKFLIKIKFILKDFDYLGINEEIIIDERILDSYTKDNISKSEINRVNTTQLVIDTNEKLNTEERLNLTMSNNPNLLMIKSNFKQERELDENDIDTEKDLREQIDFIDLQLLYLRKKNMRPNYYIIDRFGTRDEILVKIIKIFETSMDEVIKNMKDYFEDTVYFQFKVADKNKKKGNSKTSKNTKNI